MRVSRPRPRRRLPLQGRRQQSSTSPAPRTTGADRTLEFELDLDPVRGRRLVLVRRHRRRRRPDRARAGWSAPQAPAQEARLAIGICTFNRPDDCVGALAALAEDPVVRRRSSPGSIVADQGNKKVRDAAGLRRGVAGPGRPAAARRAAEPRRQRRLRPDHVRGAALDRRHAPHPARRRRPARAGQHRPAVRLRPFTKTPMLVGGQMLALQDRSVLHTMGEVVAPDKFFWRAAPNTEYAPRLRRGLACASPPTCTAGSTSTTTAGGCAWSPAR